MSAEINKMHILDKKCKHVAISSLTKQEICQKLFAYNSPKQKDLVFLYNISEQAVSDIWQDKNKQLQLKLQYAFAKQIVLTDEILIEKAKNIASSIEEEQFYVHHQKLSLMQNDEGYILLSHNTHWIMYGMPMKQKFFENKSQQELLLLVLNKVSIWTRILKDWNKHLSKSSKNILLIIDGAPVYCLEENVKLNHICIEFLMPNATAHIQPCD
ncbi:23960_t:CDS:2 [Cetraspora pellucida]|uniref:23960_t:CDS:1 n=1 Tax=Cetraspora pellucida TaxID=1433469 RepID=A0A9N9N785_9GLOM|nr:23960_t:CDS:2 [Cetraspora pellucida]